MLKDQVTPQSIVLRDQAALMVKPKEEADNRRTTCEICDKSIPRRQKYITHLKTHPYVRTKSTDEILKSPIVCGTCDDRFWSYLGFERHLVMEHGIVTNELKKKFDKREDSALCRHCGTNFSLSLLQHMVQKHQTVLYTADVEYSCDECPFKCKSYQELENHLSTVHPTAAEGPAECITLDD